MNLETFTIILISNLIKWKEDSNTSYILTGQVTLSALFPLGSISFSLPFSVDFMSSQYQMDWYEKALYEVYIATNNDIATTMTTIVFI